MTKSPLLSLLSHEDLEDLVGDVVPSCEKREHVLYKLVPVLDLAELKVGDKVKIVSEKASSGLPWNPQGGMDKWLGETMTVKEISEVGGPIRMVEDQGDRSLGWAWYLLMIEGKWVEDDSLP